MKFLHTSDLHIGIRLCEYSMTEDIKHILSQIREIAVREKCAAVVIAGDIYDRSNPSPQSVCIFDSFVTALANDGIAVMAVSGNHDSPERVSYMSELLEKSGVYFSHVFDGEINHVDMYDEFGAVRFYLLPFIRPINVKQAFSDFDGNTYSDSVRFVVSRVESDADAPSRRVIITHQFVTGGEADFSADEETAGGIGNVDAAVFSSFSYTALGHLHRAHYVGAEKKNIRYSGSPIKYSFSEVCDEKSVTIVSVDENGDAFVKTEPLVPLRNMREIRGTYAEVISYESRAQGALDDYIRVILTDEDEIQDVAAKLRCVYPNLMRIAYDNSRTVEDRSAAEMETEEIDALTPKDIFAELYELQNNMSPNDEILRLAEELFNECETEIRGGEI